MNYYSENETKDINPDVYFMRQALQEAQKAARRDEVPVGAVIVCQGRIIARGHNLTETLTDVTAHVKVPFFILPKRIRNVQRNTQVMKVDVGIGILAVAS